MVFFRFFERNVPGPLPEHYSLPVPPFVMNTVMNIDWRRFRRRDETDEDKDRASNISVERMEREMVPGQV